MIARRRRSSTWRRRHERRARSTGRARSSPAPAAASARRPRCASPGRARRWSPSTSTARRPSGPRTLRPAGSGPPRTPASATSPTAGRRATSRRAWRPSTARSTCWSTTPGVGVAGPFLDDDARGLGVAARRSTSTASCTAAAPSAPRWSSAGRGQVVNIASGAGYIPNRNMAAYCASKAAVIMLSQCLRADWAAQRRRRQRRSARASSTRRSRRGTRIVGAMAGKREAARCARSASGTRRTSWPRRSPPRSSATATSCRSASSRRSPTSLLRVAPGPMQGLVARAQVL